MDNLSMQIITGIYMKVNAVFLVPVQSEWAKKKIN